MALPRPSVTPPSNSSTLVLRSLCVEVSGKAPSSSQLPTKELRSENLTFAPCSVRFFFLALFAELAPRWLIAWGMSAGRVVVRHSQVQRAHDLP